MLLQRIAQSPQNSATTTMHGVRNFDPGGN
jgi:hypothetical protein